MVDADPPERVVGENLLALVRTALASKRSVDWVRDYPDLSHVSRLKLTRLGECRDNYPALGFLLRLCEGLRIDDGLVLSAPPSAGAFFRFGGRFAQAAAQGKVGGFTSERAD